MNPKVDAYISEVAAWREEFEKLRAISLDRGLTEEFKWGLPCYTRQKSNVVIIQGFKEYCALMFFKGVLLKDTDGVLVSPGKNTQAGRQIRFTNAEQIAAMEPLLKAYIDEAIAVEEAGLEVEFKATADYETPDELQSQLDADPTLKATFEALTPGRQRAYILYFSAPKQAKTRASRVEKYRQQILAGKGLNDR